MVTEPTRERVRTKGALTRILAGCRGLRNKTYLDHDCIHLCPTSQCSELPALHAAPLMRSALVGGGRLRPHSAGAPHRLTHKQWVRWGTSCPSVGHWGPRQGQAPQPWGSRPQPGATVHDTEKVCLARRWGQAHRGQRADTEPGMLAEAEASLWTLTPRRFSRI